MQSTLKLSILLWKIKLRFEKQTNLAFCTKNTPRRSNLGSWTHSNLTHQSPIHLNDYYRAIHTAQRHKKQLRRKRNQNIENTSSKIDFKMKVHFHAVEYQTDSWSHNLYQGKLHKIFITSNRKLESTQLNKSAQHTENPKRIK